MSIIIYIAANEIMGSKSMLILKAQKLLTCFFPKGFNQFRLPKEIANKHISHGIFTSNKTIRKISW